MMTKAKRKKPLTCKKCGKKFSFSAKSHPIGRFKKHMVKEHPEWHKATIRKAKRTAKDKVRQLDQEFMAIDDILLAKAFGQEGQPQGYNAVHEQLGGLVLEALIPIVTSAVVSAVKKRRSKK